MLAYVIACIHRLHFSILSRCGVRDKLLVRGRSSNNRFGSSFHRLFYPDSLSWLPAPPGSHRQYRSSNGECFFPRIDRMMCYMHDLCNAALLKFGRHPRRLWLPWSPAAKKRTSKKDAEAEERSLLCGRDAKYAFFFTRLPCGCVLHVFEKNFLARGCDFIGYFSAQVLLFHASSRT